MQVIVKTWAGILIQASGSEANKRKSEVEQKRGKHFRSKISVLPPLKSLPPPISLSDPVSSNIDLRVNFETEIKPFLGRCLVSFLHRVPCNLATIAVEVTLDLKSSSHAHLPPHEDNPAQLPASKLAMRLQAFSCLLLPARMPLPYEADSDKVSAVCRAVEGTALSMRVSGGEDE